jgi:hypothetical protein
MTTEGALGEPQIIRIPEHFWISASMLNLLLHEMIHVAQNAWKHYSW